MQSGRGPVSLRALPSYVVYGLAAIEIAALLYFTIDVVNGPGDGGGREMGLFFFILLPFVAILAGLAAFHFGTGWIVRGIGVALILLPMAAIAWIS